MRSLAEQPGIVEIIVVNDESTDGTAGVLEEILAGGVPEVQTAALTLLTATRRSEISEAAVLASLL